MRGVYGQATALSGAVSEALRTGSHGPLFDALDPVLAGLDAAVAAAAARGAVSPADAALLREGTAVLRELAAVLRETLPEGSVGIALDLLDTAFSVLGLVPFLGEPMDALSLALSAGRRDWLGAGLSVVGLIPVVGIVGGGGKIARGLLRVRKAAKALKGAAAVKVRALLTLLGKLADDLRKGLSAAARSGASLRDSGLNALRNFRKKLTSFRKGVNQADEAADAAKSVTARANPRTRLPRSRGKWVEGTPGNGLWHSDIPEVNAATGGKPIQFINGRPVFTPWSKGQIKFKSGQLDGTDSDFDAVYDFIAARKSLPSRNAAKRYLKEAGLTPHHLGRYDDSINPLWPSWQHSPYRVGI